MPDAASVHGQSEAWRARVEADFPCSLTCAHEPLRHDFACQEDCRELRCQQPREDLIAGMIPPRPPPPPRLWRFCSLEYSNGMHGQAQCKPPC